MKYDLIHTFSAQIPKAFNQHDIAGKAIKNSGKDASIQKWLILFQDDGANLSPKNVSCMCREIPQAHDNNISRPSATLMIDRT